MITVTNYTGKDREYIKKLITSMGAEFTASMSGKNTVVVAAMYAFPSLRRILCAYRPLSGFPAQKPPKQHPGVYLL